MPETRFTHKYELGDLLVHKMHFATTPHEYWELFQVIDVMLSVCSSGYQIHYRCRGVAPGPNGHIGGARENYLVLCETELEPVSERVINDLLSLTPSEEHDRDRRRKWRLSNKPGAAAVRHAIDAKIDAEEE